jgi:SAM-dependent methyltransferase
MNTAEYGHMAQAETFHWWYRGLRAQLSKARRAHLPPEPARLLDAGCGTGGNILHAGLNDTQWGIDAAPEALAWCRRRALTRTARARVQALPFADGAFDGVISCDVLYHRAVEDKVAALREMARVLRPGGVLFINVPAFACLRSSHDEAVHTGTRFTRATLRPVIEAAGLHIRELRYWNTLLFPAAAAARLLRRGGQGRDSDLENARAGAMNSLLAGVLAVERRILRVAPLPFGLSLFCVARKQ